MYLLAMLFLVICVKPFITVEVPIVGLMGLLLYLNLIGCVVATARSGNQLFLTGSLAVAAAASDPVEPESDGHDPDPVPRVESEILEWTAAGTDPGRQCEWSTTLRLASQ